MMEIYRIKYIWVICDKEYVINGNNFLLCESAKNKIIKITWGNLDEIYYHYGLVSPFSLWSLKKGKRISFFESFLLDKRTWDIKEWKNPNFTAILKIEYKKDTASIDDILKYSDSNKAIQYLIERGISINK